MISFYNKSMKKTVFELIILVLSYLAVRYAFFDMHGSKDAPLMALAPAAFGIAASAFFGCSLTGTGTAFGYIISFMVSQLFRHDYIDPQRGNSRYSNYFILWLLSYAAIIAVCLIIDLIRKRKSSHK